MLQEIGYGEFSPTSDRELGQALAREREKLFEDLYRYVPDKAVVDVFKVKYDYHNLKVLLKARALGMDGKRLLVDAGRVEPERTGEVRVGGGPTTSCPRPWARRRRRPGRSSAPPATPSAATSLLDRAYFREMLEAAQSSGSELLHRIRPGDHRQREPALRRADPADEKRRGLPQAGAL